MDRILVKTLELAHALMEDECFLQFRLATENNDADTGLQDNIGAFNLARMNLSALNNEPEDEKTAQRKKEITAEMESLYKSIMENKNMTAYKTAQENINKVTKKINVIISGTLNGKVPEEIDIEDLCGNDCSGCAGCQ